MTTSWQRSQRWATFHVVATAAAEEDAVQWLALHTAKVDLVILDLMLAEGSGIGVIRALRRGSMRAPVVVLTNYASQDIRERCLALGAAAMFDKSQRVDEFLAFCHAATSVVSDRAIVPGRGTRLTA